MTITVSDLMRKSRHYRRNCFIQETAKKMKDNKVSSLLVLDIDGKPIGLVTERDLVRKVCINDVRTSEVTNKSIMSSPLITVDSKSSPSTGS